MGRMRMQGACAGAIFEAHAHAGRMRACRAHAHTQAHAREAGRSACAHAGACAGSPRDGGNAGCAHACALRRKTRMQRTKGQKEAFWEDLGAILGAPERRNTLGGGGGAAVVAHSVAPPRDFLRKYLPSRDVQSLLYEGMISRDLQHAVPCCAGGGGSRTRCARRPPPPHQGCSACGL